MPTAGICCIEGAVALAAAGRNACLGGSAERLRGLRGLRPGCACHVECAPLQILFKSPTPAIYVGNATNPYVLLTFDNLHNPLCLPHKTTSERPKVPRTPQFFALLTSKGASRHKGVHFFDISTSKSVPIVRCF